MRPPESDAIRSEDDYFRYLHRFFVNEHPRLRLGRGDDCAVFEAMGPSCVTTDLFLEDVHFRTRYFTAAELGHKALAVNLSDVAGMGARPVAFFLDLMIPSDGPHGLATAPAFWDEFFAAMAALADRHGVVLAGGDLSAGPCLGAAITVWGEEADAVAQPSPSANEAARAGVRLLTRGPTRPGDVLFVVGPLGLARVGLTRLEQEGRDAIHRWPAATSAHLTPEPHVEAGLALARFAAMEETGRPSDWRAVTGLMDLSDGVARDLPRLLGGRERSIGARLQVEPSSLHPEVLKHAEAVGEDPVGVALDGGEDYALLGAADPTVAERLAAAIPGTRLLGEVTDEPGLTLNGRPFTVQGFDHLSRRSEHSEPDDA